MGISVYDFRNLNSRVTSEGFSSIQINHLPYDSMNNASFNMPYGLNIRVLALLLGMTVMICPDASAAFRSPSGTMSFDSNADGTADMTLTTSALAVGQGLSPSTNLHIQGNAMITNDMVVGSSSAGNSTLHVNGSFGTGMETLSDNVTIGNVNLVLADSSSGNITLTLPYAGNVTGRRYTVKKTSTSNEVVLSGGTTNIDSGGFIVLTSGNMAYVNVASNGSQWYIVGQSPSGSADAWTPADITTALWLDANDTDTLWADAGRTTPATTDVYTWDDKSGGSYHAVQSSGTEQPSTGGTAINGRNTLAFDGTEYMSTASNPFGATISDAHVFQVFKTASTLVQGANFSLTEELGANDRFSVHGPWNDGTMYFDPGDASTNRISSASWATTDEVIMASFYSSTTEGTKEVWKNGTSSVSAASATSQSVTGGIIVGDFTSGGNSPQKFDLAEMIVINGTVSTATRQKIEGYLAHKWGLEGSLPAGHPYKGAAPTK